MVFFKLIFRKFAIMYPLLIHKLGSVAMTFFVLMSTFSFPVKKHFCGDTLIDVAIFSQVKTCGMEVNDMARVASEENPCCNDELEIVKGQDQLKKTTFEDFQMVPQVFLRPCIISYFDLYESSSEQTFSHKNYSPPNLISDIHILDQVFLI